ncbi:S-layer homology domain-containing protein [Bacillus thermotolerans]|uniref:S-layer homology domain-containing protein n=1 Tax=Bacillus thermotolerans TaxID=1221996 RepID=UPI00058067A3|nr:S-layer homology domain-containing protein [Bacillus thermotolerans]KKB35469.1 hypothetical protein QY97_01647 [Bacillus thermotolerans]
MLKKFPFSNKAAKAMIAATVAFTPIATVPGLLEGSQVEAAEQNFTDLESLIAYLQTVKGELSEEQLQAVEQAQQNAEANNVSDYANRLLNANTTDQEKELITASIQLLLDINLMAVGQAALDEFKEAQSQNVQDVFGTEAAPVTIDQYVNYLYNVEAAFLDNIQLRDSSKITNSIYIETLIAALMSGEDKTPNNAIKKKLIQLVNFDNARGAVFEYLEKVDPGAAAGKAFVSGIKGETGNDDSNDDDNSNDNGDTDDNTDDNADDTIATPGSANPTDTGVTVTPAITADGQAVITTDMYDSITHPLTSEKSQVAIELPEETTSVLIPITLIDQLGLVLDENLGLIRVKSGDVTYDVNPSDVDTAALAGKLGASVQNVSVKVSVAPVSTEREQQVAAKVEAAGATLLSPIVDFTLEATDGEETIPVDLLGQKYIDRAFTLSEAVNANKATGIRINEDGSFQAVPTIFNEQTATVKSLQNSEFAVIQGDVTFPDVNNGENWAEAYIETLASKQVIKGGTNGKYNPDQYMTRAQFAVLLSRALGLPGAEYDDRFEDVEGDEWFNENGAFMAAVKSGIIKGRTDGNFAPNDQITRNDATAMIGRALNLDYVAFDLAKLDTDKAIADFKDARDIGASTRQDVLRAYQAGIVNGTSKGTFEPDAFTKRDQMAKILAEFLIAADLMNDID